MHKLDKLKMWKSKQRCVCCATDELMVLLVEHLSITTFMWMSFMLLPQV